MRHVVKLPVMGDTTQNVVVSEWLVQPGSAVQAGQALLAVETDKVTAEVPAPVSGTVVEQLVRPEQEIGIGTAICVIEA